MLPRHNTDDWTDEDDLARRRDQSRTLLSPVPRKRFYLKVKEQPESRGLIDYRKEKKFNMNMNT